MLFPGLVAFLTMFFLSPGRSTATVQRYPLVDAAVRRDRVLIVAPHVDDEAIGARGYAVDPVAHGPEVYVVFLTAGHFHRLSARPLHQTLGPTASHYLSLGP